MPAEENELPLPRQFLGLFVRERRALRARADKAPAFDLDALAEPIFHRLEYRLGLEQHPRPAPERLVVAGTMLVVRIIPNIDELDLHFFGRNRSFQYRMRNERIEHTGEQRQNSNFQR